MSKFIIIYYNYNFNLFDQQTTLVQVNKERQSTLRHYYISIEFVI